MKRLLANIKYVLKKSCEWTIAVFAFLGLIGTFAPLSDLLADDLELWKRIVFSIAVLCVIWLITFIISAIIISFKRKYLALEVNNHCVYVQYGDIFSPNETCGETPRRNIVIPVNRCFDTLVDDDLISSNTLHGKAIKRIISRGVSQEKLNSAIQSNLKKQGLLSETILRTQKRSGNLERYPVGSVAEIQETNECTFFLLGLTSFDDKLTASVSVEDYVVALTKALKFCNYRSQQYPVLMPLIGGGLSRTGKSERDILEYLIKLIKLNKDLIQFDLHIIVRENGRDTVPISDL